ncbi:hypothetical protein EKO27_g1898 [Xylaria grammica]|uniref:Protein kinase domain-containing protein n=1 Tax=Xylaria grammica TaxID=363999 RepID=A0A439DFP5_9PEZI|nr:hypothetical protein EKO27_g1898 [Xylaria grammica]
MSTGSLCDNIAGRLAKSKYCNGAEENYLPEGSLDDLMTAEEIKKELSQIPPLLLSSEAEQQFIGFIGQNAKKVFAAATLSKFRPEKVYKLINNLKIIDEKLPIDATASPLLELLGPWDAEQFGKHQWKFLVPVFKEDTLVYNLESQHILPFTQVGTQQKEGTFGIVSEVKIHEAHQRYQDMIRGELHIAVKEIVAQKIAYAADQSGLDDVKEAWKTEATALDKLTEVKHKHLVQCIAAIDKKDKYYFLFPWADGGSLQDFWEEFRNPSLSPEFIKEVLEQIRGLAEALKTLHGYRGRAATFRQGIDADNDASAGGGIRHGDLKPANILRFTPRDNNDIGTLKIADMGLAKHHEVNTRLRANATRTRFGTARYEPPEVGAPKLATAATSRLYDVWSMGCIILELLIWLLHGTDKLGEFNNTIGRDLKQDYSYYKVEETGGVKAAKVHDRVANYIKTLAKDPACAVNTALGDLLNLVDKKLLVVQLPTSSTEERDGPVSVTPAEPIGTNTGPYRASAASLLESLEDIISKSKNKVDYLCTERGQLEVPTVRSTPGTISSGNLHPNSANVIRDPGAGSAAELTLAATRMSGNPFDINIWEYQVDNGFAASFLNKLTETSNPLPFPKPVASEQLCEACLKLDFWAPKFHITDSLSNLKKSAETCRFCTMRWNASSHLHPKAREVRFDRAGSVIKMNESDPPVFSICRTNYSGAPGSVQIGLPVVFDAGNAAHFQLINCWLTECDSKHGAYKCTSPPTGEAPLPAINTNEDNLELAILHKTQSRKAFKLPTRLIDVGDINSPTCHLYETQPGDKSENFRYFALSHRWGIWTPERPHFYSTVENKEALMKEIDVARLPGTFRDAVITTRALGVRYLWIDSICIIQGVGGDFGSESKRMEDVFSAAYCVLAATCASGQWDGFLTSRPPREYVTFRPGSDSSFYVCQYIDDFNQEVLEGDMNKRGWVLQERALARRTIYFAGNQTYFECGAGVRCETLTKMDNRLAAFLGDPNFPQVAILSHHSERGTSRSEKILYYQDLYKKYSRLEFSRWEDRAVAMEGLEQRLSRAFESRGKFGILADKLKATNRSFLHRSLLWHRGTDQSSLTKIIFPPDRQKAPSWSWMSYRGGIDYLDVPFDSVEWESRDIRSPWQSTDARTTGSWMEEVMTFSAVARKFAAGQKVGEDVKIVYDETGMTAGSVSRVLCVIIGKTKGSALMENKTHYVLLVAPGAVMTAKGTKVYERIGAGSMPGRLIDFEEPGLDIKIQ